MSILQDPISVMMILFIVAASISIIINLKNRGKKK